MEGVNDCNSFATEIDNMFGKNLDPDIEFDIVIEDDINEATDGTVMEEEIMHSDVSKPFELNFEDIIKTAAKKLSSDKCFPLYNDVFANFKSCTADVATVKNVYNPLVKIYQQKQNAERFYSKCHQNTLLKHIFPSLPSELSSLLCSEISNFCLAAMMNIYQDRGTTKESPPVIKFTEKDIHCIQYLSGYCFRTVYQRVRRKKNWESSNSQQYLLTLKAAKLDSTDGQPLISSRDKGGLWAVNNKAIEIFKSCEMEFCKTTASSPHNIDIKTMVLKLMKNSQVLSNFDDISKSADCYIKDNIAVKLLKTLITLYLRARGHSYAKKIKEKHKMKTKKTSQKKSLRNSIKASSNSSTKHETA